MMTPALILDLSSLSEKTTTAEPKSLSDTTTCTKSPAAATTCTKSLSGTTTCIVAPTAKATKALLARFKEALFRVMWRAEDVAAETDMVQQSLEVGNLVEADIETAIVQLTAAAVPMQISMNILGLDGSCQSVPVQPRYISALDLNCFGHTFRTSEDSVTSLASIADLKVQIQKFLGVPSRAQMLYYINSDGAECDALNDDETIINLQERGFKDGHSLYMVVDTERHYWQLHARLAATFRKPLTAGYKAMLSLMPAATTRMHSRAVKFCKTCRRALAFLNETRGTSKTRSIDVLDKVEKHMTDTILPILRAVAVRLQNAAGAEDGDGLQ